MSMQSLQSTIRRGPPIFVARCVTVAYFGRNNSAAGSSLRFLNCRRARKLNVVVPCWCPRIWAFQQHPSHYNARIQHARWSSLLPFLNSVGVGYTLQSCDDDLFVLVRHLLKFVQNCGCQSLRTSRHSVDHTKPASFIERFSDQCFSVY